MSDQAKQARLLWDKDMEIVQFKEQLLEAQLGIIHRDKITVAGEKQLLIEQGVKEGYLIPDDKSPPDEDSEESE